MDLSCGAGEVEEPKLTLRWLEAQRAGDAHDRTGEDRVQKRVLAIRLPALRLNHPARLSVTEKSCQGEELAFVRLPGFVAGTPAAHSGHCGGSKFWTVRVTSEARGQPSSTVPPLRSISAPVATTFPPASSTAAIVSRVDPPVVITSSTTIAGSPGESWNPRRRVIRPSTRSVNNARTPSARPTSCATRTPPSAGATTTEARLPASFQASSLPSRSATNGCWRTRAH